MRKISLIILSLISLAVHLFADSYYWPMKKNTNNTGDFNGPLNVIATQGDYRITTSPLKHRFHQGIDIDAEDGRYVFSISTGIVGWGSSTGNNENMYIGNYLYTHIKDRIPENYNILYSSTVYSDPTNLNNDFKICKVRDYMGDSDTSNDHLDFCIITATDPYDGTSYNPLIHAGGPKNPTDTKFPCVGPVAFYREDGLTENDIPGDTLTQIQSNSLKGKIDIRAKCYDRQETQNSGIYAIGWGLKSSTGGWVVQTNTTIMFNQVFPPVNGDKVKLIYDTRVTEHATSLTFHYWVTNTIESNQIKNRWWNTKLLNSATWYGGGDATNNQEAKYPDGKYILTVTAYDVKNSSGYNQEVIIDNHLPKVSSVTTVGQKLNLGIQTEFSESMDTGTIILNNFEFRQKTGETTYNILTGSITYSEESLKNNDYNNDGDKTDYFALFLPTCPLQG